MKYERYENGVIVESYDHRTVSQTAQERLEMAKTACKTAIEDTGIAWMVEREVTGGKSVPQSVKDLCASYRALNAELETRINALVSQATDNDDKAICDQIEQVNWTN
jgi:uncharacterized protein involved in propanediol utilization